MINLRFLGFLRFLIHLINRLKSHEKITIDILIHIIYNES